MMYSWDMTGRTNAKYICESVLGRNYGDQLWKYKNETSNLKWALYWFWNGLKYVRYLKVLLLSYGYKVAFVFLARVRKIRWFSWFRYMPLFCFVFLLHLSLTFG